MSSWLDFVLLVLASFRLTRLIVYDQITEFIRQKFHTTVEEMSPEGTLETFVEIKGTGLKYWIGELLSCHWCTGIWTSTALYFGYLLIPSIVIPVISVLAIAGGASIAQYFIIKD